MDWVNFLTQLAIENILLSKTGGQELVAIQNELALFFTNLNSDPVLLSRFKASLERGIRLA